MKSRKIEKLWDERSKKYGSRIEGVLPKSYPLELNFYLDNWMYEQIKKNIPDQKKIKILDLGCGYGRLASKIIKDFPNTHVIGLDISQTYVDLYNRNLKPKGSALKGDLIRLPFNDSEFDIVYVVTTFMYLLDIEEQIKSLKEISRVLKKGGKYIFIERSESGQKFVTLWGIINFIRGKENKEISAVSFSRDNLVFLSKKNIGKLEQISGIPLWTITFHINFLMFKLKIKQWKKILEIVKSIDNKISGLTLPSLYIYYQGIKE